MWHLTSRVHRLNHFPTNGATCFVKRDDELGCGINGSKLRKYASLMPSLIKSGVAHLIIIAGPQSNNLLAALQMAREYQLKVTAFLLKPWGSDIRGNFKLTRLFLDEHEIVWVARDEWNNVELRANAFLHGLTEQGFILTEGASVLESMSGAMSLASDIVQNEQDLGISFDHIFVDAGTGFTAAALIKGLSKLKHKALVHVFLLADDEDIFRNKLNKWVGDVGINVLCYRPKTAKAFGAVNQTIKKEIKRLAKEEGILADPIYAAKLFHAARETIETVDLKGNILIIHSGGTLSMAGFELF